MLFTLIDLTHELHELIPTWEGDTGFAQELAYEGDVGPLHFRVTEIQMSTGVGTHMDAPAHGVLGGRTIADMPLERCFVSGVVLDVSDRAHERYVVSVDDILLFEKQHGVILSGSLVLIHTGWSSRWSTPGAYRNNLQFPTVSEAAAALLVERNVVGMGIDTLSPDLPTADFPVHRLFFQTDKYLIENVAHADKLPPRGSCVLVLPLKISGGTEAPVRLVGYVPVLRDPTDLFSA